MNKRLKRYNQADAARKEEIAATQRAQVVGESGSEDEDEEDAPSKRKMETD